MTATITRLDERTILERLARQLGALGPDPGAITENLRAHQITGRRHAIGEDHPLVRQLRRWGARAESLWLLDNALTVWLVAGATPHAIDLPLPVRHWLHRWARGEYADLEER